MQGSDPTRPLSIREFITDGSLSALCAELTSLTGVRIRLLDPQRRPVLGPSPHDLPTPDTSSLGLDPQPSILFPISTAGVEIGWLEMADAEPTFATGSTSRDLVAHLLRLIGSTAGEFCDHELELRRRVRELDVTYRLTSVLARATGLEQTLANALDSALDILSLEAGTIALFDHATLDQAPDREDAVVHKVSRGLSRDWLDSPLPLSRDRVFDRLCAAGEIVAVDDLADDPRVLIPDRARAEGLKGFIGAGLLFQSRLLGVIRLYSKAGRPFTEDDHRLLRSIAEQAAVAMQQARLLALQAEERRVQRQLQLAAEVQRRMLPDRLPAFPALDLAARYVPSFELGGDFYDFMELAGHLALAVGDVVGKGVPAALLMAAVRASLRAHTQQLYHLDEVITRVNRDLSHDTRDHEFASLFYGVIDPRTLRLTYCSAGHDPTFVFRADAPRHPDELTTGGMLVGIDAAQRYDRSVFQLRPGDTLVAYTDGLTDALDFQGRRFGKARLRDAIAEVLARDPACSASGIVEHVFWTLRQFAGLAPQSDDQTLVVLRVRRETR